MSIGTDENTQRAALRLSRPLWYLPMGKGGTPVANTLIYSIMKDHHQKNKGKKASELISLDMKARETVRARDGGGGREIGGHLLTFLRVGGIKGSTAVICSSLCVLTCSLRAGMLSTSAGWNQTFECDLNVGVGNESGLVSIGWLRVSGLNKNRRLRSPIGICEVPS